MYSHYLYPVYRFPGYGYGGYGYPYGYPTFGYGYGNYIGSAFGYNNLINTGTASDITQIASPIVI